MVKVPFWLAKTPKSICTPTLLKLIFRPASSLKSAKMLPNVRQSLHSMDREKLSVADASMGTGPPIGIYPVPPVQFLFGHVSLYSCTGLGQSNAEKNGWSWTCQPMSKVLLWSLRDSIPRGLIGARSDGARAPYSTWTLLEGKTDAQARLASSDVASTKDTIV
jgi:hypothetical protein